MKIKYILIISAITFFSCGDRTTFKNRTISDVKLKEINCFEYEDGQIIRMTADDNCIYLSSSPDNTIKVLNYNGKLCKSIGQKGEAPWENGTIWSYGKDSSCYWMHDFPKMALKKYDAKMDTLLLFRRFQTKHNVLFLRNNQFVVPNVKSETGVFYLSLYDALKDTIIKSVNICSLSGKFKKLIPFGDFTFQGDFCKNDSGQAVFYCMYNSSFYFIDKDFKISNHFDIRNLPIGVPSLSEQGMIRLNPENIGIISGTMDNKYIYLLAPKYHEIKRNRLKFYMIDVYDINTKKYLKSFEMPNPKEDRIKAISKTNKGFVVAYSGGTVTVYNNNFIKDIEKNN